MSNITNLNDFKNKKKAIENKKSLTDTVDYIKRAKNEDPEAFDARLKRIKSSLEHINNTMFELRKLSNQKGNSND